MKEQEIRRFVETLVMQEHLQDFGQCQKVFVHEVIEEVVSRTLRLCCNCCW